MINLHLLYHWYDFTSIYYDVNLIKDFILDKWRASDIETSCKWNQIKTWRVEWHYLYCSQIFIRAAITYYCIIKSSWLPCVPTPWLPHSFIPSPPFTNSRLPKNIQRKTFICAYLTEQGVLRVVDKRCTSTYINLEMVTDWLIDWLTHWHILWDTSQCLTSTIFVLEWKLLV